MESVSAAFENIERLAQTIVCKEEGDKFYAAETMALKFASNETILEAAIQDGSLCRADRRDLLG